MALGASDSFSSFDATTNRRLDISPVLSTILLNDQATLGLLGQGPAVMRTEHRFGEDSLNPPTVTDDGSALGIGATSLAVLDASKVRIGAILMDQAATLTDLMQVTDIVGNTLTVDRNYGGTGDLAHAANAVYAIVGQPVQEGDETIADISRDRTQESNVTQIFKRTIKVSGTQEAEAQNGVHPGVPSELRLQVARRAMELGVELNRAVLNSYQSSVTPQGSDTVYRTMKGIRQYLTEGGASSNLDATAEAISEVNVNSLYKLAWDKGGSPTALVGNSNQINAFASFNTNKFRIAPSDRAVGTFVEKYLTEFGAELSLVLDRWARVDEVYLLDPSKAHIAPMQGRAMFTEPLAKVGDAMRWQIVMEATLILMNKNEGHAIHTNLT